MKTLPSCDSIWAALYTRSRYEKHLHERLSEQKIESYLPLHRVLEQWSDRKKWVEKPLFPSYLFVRITERERYRVLNTPGAVRYVTFEGKLARVREEEIACIRRLAAYEAELEAVPDYLQKGAPVHITGGSLTGLQGELVAYQSSKRILLRIESIQQSVLVSVPFGWIEPVKPLPVEFKGL
jgi:transcription antitermination factor NusG